MVEFNKFAVGRVVRQLRKSRGLSQEVFSGLVGIARSHLAMIESGSKQAILKQCGALPTPLIWLPMNWFAWWKKKSRGEREQGSHKFFSTFFAKKALNLRSKLRNR